MPTDQALALAEEKGLDLVEIGPKSTPPVAKILEYGKFLYDKRKKEKVAKQNSHVTEVKAIQITIGTGEHDLELKAKNASKWLKEGHRVKIDLFLRGRAKYLDPKFHHERLTRILHFITEPYKAIEEAKKSHKGLTIIIERDKTQNKNENKQIILKENPTDEKREAHLA